MMLLSCFPLLSANAEWQLAFGDQLGVEQTRLASLGELPDGCHRVQFASDHTLDIQKESIRLGGTAQVVYNRPAILVHTFQSERDGELIVGAGADWYLAVFCNGRPCFENLLNGNPGGPVSARDILFKIPVKKGINRLALLVRAGSGGWKIAFQQLEDTPENRSRLAGSTGGGAEYSLNFQPWITDCASGTATIRFATRCASYAAVDCRKSGDSEWNRCYEHQGYFFLRDAYHAVRLAGLDADARYEFRIVLFAEQELTKGGYMPFPPKNEIVLPGIFQFRSAPLPEAGFRFALMSDTHFSSPIRRGILERFDKRFDFGKFAFFVHLGDLAQALDHFDDQALYGFTDHFNCNGTLLPLCIVHGNHEYSGREMAKWLSAFGSPNMGSCRAFRYGNVFFVVLDYWKDDFIGREMEDWAVEALQSAESCGATFRVVLNHKEAFAPDYPPSPVAPLLERLNQVARIHLLLNGHMHRYCRTEPETGSCLLGMELESRKEPNIPRTCATVTLAGGGGDASVLGFTEVEVTADQLHVRNSRVDGSVFDEFSIDRDGNLR